MDTNVDTLVGRCVRVGPMGGCWGELGFVGHRDASERRAAGKA
jgi:hypothetical protein